MKRRSTAYLNDLRSDICVYCGKVATTRDHIVARTLLVRPLPQNAPTVPSCRACNNRFSKDEQYFVAVLGMIGRTPEMEARVEDGGDIFRALDRAPKLDERLISSVIPSLWPGGPPMCEFEESRLGPLFQKIAFGLFLMQYRPKMIPPLDAFKTLSIQESATVQKMNVTATFRHRPWTSLQKNVFDYCFFKSNLQPFFGIRYCLMRFYGSTFFGAVQCPI